MRTIQSVMCVAVLGVGLAGCCGPMCQLEKQRGIPSTGAAELLQTLWHPNGSLVQGPTGTRYLVEGNGLTPFLTESAFASRNYDEQDVTVISAAELACYSLNDGLADTTEIIATSPSAQQPGSWLMVGMEGDPERYSLQIQPVGWQTVLTTWGIEVLSDAEAPSDEESSAGTATYHPAGIASFRDGSLVSPLESSTVYVMSDGMAMPIDTWDVLQFLGWEDRVIFELPATDFADVVSAQGDCALNISCLSLEDGQTCGGQLE